MTDKHELENLMRSTMENLRDMIDVNTVIGDVVETSDGTSIVPISKVSFGFASGGSEFGNHTTLRKNEEKYPFGGGSGAGVSVKPIKKKKKKDGVVKLQPVDYDNTIDRVVDSIPQVIEMVKDFFIDKKADKKVTNIDFNDD